MDSDERPRLSRETMIETALRLLDEVGLEGLTVRRLAAEFGVQSPALYWHIRTKQQLLDGMADAIILASGMGPPRDEESWQEWLARRARAYRDSLLAHRDGARIVCAAVQLRPATVRMFDEELSAMVERGFTPAQALRTITGITHYVNGFVLQKQVRAERQESAAPPGERLAALAARPDRGASAPLIAALLEGGDPLGEEPFEHGLRAFIDGTAAALHASGQQPHASGQQPHASGQQPHASGRRLHTSGQQ